MDSNNSLLSSYEYDWNHPAPPELTDYNVNATFPAHNAAPQFSAGASLAVPASSVPAQQSYAPGADQRPVATVGRKRSRRRLDWDMHKTQLGKLYLEDDRKLEDIREIMQNDESFDATPKQYKEKFKSWGWQKNLPVDKARFMAWKANERKKAPVFKDTVFQFGGQTWTGGRAEMSVKRARQQLPEVMDMETPAGVVYQTPIALDPASPETVRTPRDQGNDITMTMSGDSSSDQWESDDEIESNPLPLTWNGKTVTDLHNDFQTALVHMRNGDGQNAERLLQSTINGYEVLLSPTHEETSKAVYKLASFYVEHDRVPEANKVIEQSSRVHVEELGIEHKRTQQHVAHVVELFNGWNREDDAFAFLARAKELAQGGLPRTGGRKPTSQKGAKSSRPKNAVQNTPLPEYTCSISDNPHPAELDHGIGVARTYVLAKDRSIVEFLQSMIHLSGKARANAPIQNLQARTELLKLYQKLGTAWIHRNSFEDALASFHLTVAEYPWARPTREKFKSLRVIEASLELGATFLKADFTSAAKQIFQRTEEIASDVFGWDNERTIWMRISIGLVYQNCKGWDHAKQWFQSALSAAMSAYDEDDGIRISLEEAMEVRHFSYLNDEGRPYKTIFGVNGLKIMPTRLHLE